MRLVNETPFAVGLLRSERPDDVLANALVLRTRQGIEGGKLGPPPPALVLTDLRYGVVDCGEWGELAPDELMPRTGTDVIIIGEAICPEPSIATRVQVQVGDYDVALDVFGDRTWESVLGNLVPTHPLPFSRMALTYKRAYGGPALGEYGPIPWPMNPIGKGFYLKSSDAKDHPLPNVESSTDHIKAWDDRPAPMGFAPYPQTWGLRTDRFVKVDEASEKIEIAPEEGMFDRAHPSLSGKIVKPGPMRIKGMTPSGFLELDIAPCPAEVHIAIGQNLVVRDLDLEEILVDFRTGVVDITYRKMFRYPFVRHQYRETRVVLKGSHRVTEAPSLGELRR